MRGNSEKKIQAQQIRSNFLLFFLSNVSAAIRNSCNHSGCRLPSSSIFRDFNQRGSGETIHGQCKQILEGTPAMMASSSNLLRVCCSLVAYSSKITDTKVHFFLLLLLQGENFILPFSVGNSFIFACFWCFVPHEADTTDAPSMTCAVQRYDGNYSYS